MCGMWDVGRGGCGPVARRETVMCLMTVRLLLSTGMPVLCRSQRSTTLLQSAASQAPALQLWTGGYLVSRTPSVWAWESLDAAAAASVGLRCGIGCGPWGTAQVRVCGCSALAPGVDGVQARDGSTHYRDVLHYLVVSLTQNL